MAEERVNLVTPKQAQTQKNHDRDQHEESGVDPPNPEKPPSGAEISTHLKVK
jgi:hypothetical protein